VSFGTKICTGEWVAVALAWAVFILSVFATLIFSVFGEAPSALIAINGLMVPWGVLAIVLMVVLRSVAGDAVRKEQAHGR
jgi:hypothetical protein